MSFIHCSLDCEYQNDGYCNLNRIENTVLSSNQDCLYYKNRKKPPIVKKHSSVK